MNRIGFVGFGALGRQMLALIGAPRDQRQLVLFDDVLYRGGVNGSAPFDSILEERFADCEFFLGLGYHHLALRASVVRELVSAGRCVPAWMHPSCQVHPTAYLGSGCFLYPLCNVGADVMLSDGVLLNNSVVISHDTQIGPGAYLSPGVVLSGHVQIGEAAFLGSGVVVGNNRRIGVQARVGVGTIVTRDVPDGASAIGNPIRLLDNALELE